MSGFIPQQRGIKVFSLAAVLSMLVLLAALSLSIHTVRADAPTANLTLATDTLTLGVSPVVTGTGFTAGEEIALWLTAPDQTVRLYGKGKADSSGTLASYSYKPTTDTYKGYSQAQLATLEANYPGQWFLTAQGISSGAVGIASFKMLTPTVSANITNVSGNLTTIQIGAAFFYSYEPVGLWLSDTATGVVIPLSTMLTSSIGVIPASADVTGTNVVTLTFQNSGTTGPYNLTAYGNFSTQQVVIPVTVGAN